MILIHFCLLDAQPATGLRYVRVRLYCGDPPREQAEWQMSDADWHLFLSLLKPSRSLEVAEVPLAEWRAYNVKAANHRPDEPNGPRVFDPAYEHPHS